MNVARPIVPSAPPPPARRRTLLELIEERAETSPAAPALLAPGREAMCYADLVAQVRAVGKRLRSFGLGPGDRVAVALPDSAETAVMMVAALAHCAAAPVNPRATGAEVERQLTAVRARAVIVPGGANPAARGAAERVAIPAIELRAERTDPAGRFRLEPLTPPEFYATESSAPQAQGLSGLDGARTALVIHTPGTTGFPKIVPLTQDNLLSAMLANCEVLGLMPLDRCLSVMPLCHVHGLGAILCSLLSGASAAILPGFAADAFFESLGRLAPTWYTAVPAIHQSVLERAPAHEAVVRKVAGAKSLRFVRSGSAPMPRGVPERLEKLFNTVYVEACGATEASAYLLSNRPGRARIGSVGTPLSGVEVRIISREGKPVEPGNEGELVVRGPGVFRGYEDNPAATAAAFVDGFFRTGDLARCDADGFYYLTGRTKEQINRGGAKVSPYEVEDALLLHPDVVQAVAFAVPDPLLGEEVAAAVVVRDGAPEVNELHLQRHAALYLADHKVPRRIVFVEKVPTGRKGKVVRLELAEQLGLGDAADIANLAAALPPAEQPGRKADRSLSPTEQAMTEIWSEVLGRQIKDPDVPFEKLGVDSLQVLQISVTIERRFGRALPPAALSTHRTVRAAAALLDADGWTREPSGPVVLREGDPSEPSLFVVPGLGGSVYSYYALAHHLPASRRVVGLPLAGDDVPEVSTDLPRSIDAVAERLASAVLREQPQGPYLLCGRSFGGHVAFEVARRLVSSGSTLQLLAMLDTPAPGWVAPDAAGGATGWRRVASLFRGRADKPAEVSSGWRPEPLDIRLCLIRSAAAATNGSESSDAAMGWTAFAVGGVEVITIPGHGTPLDDRDMPEIASAIAKLIDSQ